MIGACLCCFILSLIGAPILGATICLMLIGLVYFGRQQLTLLQAILKDQSCLHYLQSFDLWLETAIEQYVKIYRLFYPILFALCALRFMISDLAQKMPGEWGLIASNSEIAPIAYMLITVVSILLGAVGGRIYRADVHLVYGTEIKKLKALIAELQEIKMAKQDD